MNKEQLLSDIVTMHNLLIEINVKGDDTLRMADVITLCRRCHRELQNAIKEEGSQVDNASH